MFELLDAALVLLLVVLLIIRTAQQRSAAADSVATSGRRERDPGATGEPASRPPSPSRPSAPPTSEAAITAAVASMSPAASGSSPSVQSPYVPVTRPRPTAAEAPVPDPPDVASVRDARRVARQGEARATVLDACGWTFTALGLLVALGAATILIVAGDSLSRETVLGIVIGASSAVLLLTAVGLMLLGMAAVVRSSARQLALAAERVGQRTVERVA